MNERERMNGRERDDEGEEGEEKTENGWGRIKRGQWRDGMQLMIGRHIQNSQIGGNEEGGGRLPNIELYFERLNASCDGTSQLIGREGDPSPSSSLYLALSKGVSRQPPPLSLSPPLSLPLPLPLSTPANWPARMASKQLQYARDYRPSYSRGEGRRGEESLGEGGGRMQRGTGVPGRNNNNGEVPSSSLSSPSDDFLDTTSLPSSSTLHWWRRGEEEQSRDRRGCKWGNEWWEPSEREREGRVKEGSTWSIYHLFERALWRRRREEERERMTNHQKGETKKEGRKTVFWEEEERKGNDGEQFLSFEWTSIDSFLSYYIGDQWRSNWFLCPFLS